MQLLDSVIYTLSLTFENDLIYTNLITETPFCSHATLYARLAASELSWVHSEELVPQTFQI